LKKLRPYQQQAVTECWRALIENDEPVLLMASVGAGKSLMLATILLKMQKVGKKALCIVNNSELVRNNCETFIQQGGEASIYCAALGEKNADSSIIFGTPQTILNGINKNEDIANIKFNLLIVDEAHGINHLNDRSLFIRILRHFKQEYPLLRILGATGTNYRFKGSQIVGENCLFKKQVGNITTEQLIQDEFLINPNFEIDNDLMLDFSRVKIKPNGKFDQKQLEEVIDKSTRLTELICKQIIHIMSVQNRFGIFIFATTKKHADEIMSHLPSAESALILGETPHSERTRILENARKGQIRYIVNIAIISVGVDVPAYDTLAYLRPTESLVLLVQTIGRVLRLSPGSNKTESLILDFAGNIERHRDWDNPILMKALNQTIDKDKQRPIICPRCQALNTETARRCIGVRIYEDALNLNPKQIRCDYYFEFKECVNEACGIKNDIACRHCRECKTELIDPNKKLTLEPCKEDLKRFDVVQSTYNLVRTKTGFRINCGYLCKQDNGRVVRFFENYTPSSEKAKYVFYGQFIKKHCKRPSDWYKHLTDAGKMAEMLKEVNSPLLLMVKADEKGYRIKKKIFSEMPV
jgi:DNA repair protein RadD